MLCGYSDLGNKFYIHPEILFITKPRIKFAKRRVRNFKKIRATENTLNIAESLIAKRTEEKNWRKWQKYFVNCVIPYRLTNSLLISDSIHAWFFLSSLRLSFLFNKFFFIRLNSLTHEMNWIQTELINLKKFKIFKAINSLAKVLTQLERFKFYAKVSAIHICKIIKINLQYPQHTLPSCEIN